MTLADLLAHRGGVTSDLRADQPELFTLAQTQRDADPQSTRATIVTRLLQIPANEAVGTPSTSRAGYAVIAAALERSTGMSFEDLMRIHVFGPLGMSSGCRFGHDPDEMNQPSAHTRDGGRVTAIEAGASPALPSFYNASTTIRCTLSAAALFGSAHLGGGPADFLSDESRERLHSTNGGPLGFSSTDPAWADTGLLSDGASPVSYALMWLQPDEDRGFVIALNIYYPEIEEDVAALAQSLVRQFF